MQRISQPPRGAKIVAALDKGADALGYRAKRSSGARRSKIAAAK